MTGEELLDVALVWSATNDVDFPYIVEHEGRRYVMRLNDFPAEPLFTLIEDGVELFDLEDWPPAWHMPGPPRELLEALTQVAKPRCRGPIALVARSGPGEPVDVLAEHDGEIVAGATRRLDAQTLEPRPPPPHARSGPPAPDRSPGEQPFPRREGPPLVALANDGRTSFVASGQTIDVLWAGDDAAPIAQVDLQPLGDEVRSLLPRANGAELLVGTMRGLVLRFALTIDLTDRGDR